MRARFWPDVDCEVGEAAGSACRVQAAFAQGALLFGSTRRESAELIGGVGRLGQQFEPRGHPGLRCLWQPPEAQPQQRRAHPLVLCHNGRRQRGLGELLWGDGQPRGQRELGRHRPVAGRSEGRPCTARRRHRGLCGILCGLGRTARDEDAGRAGYHTHVAARAAAQATQVAVALGRRARAGLLHRQRRRQVWQRPRQRLRQRRGAVAAALVSLWPGLRGPVCPRQRGPLLREQ
mmetsp:Transcript_13595/g.34188  ORF Transcript_13595/g.34188 Transcript_13595/m.34188 type:complete len:234 (+) Transcript_13595:71-772(+)